MSLTQVLNEIETLITNTGLTLHGDLQDESLVEASNVQDGEFLIVPLAPAAPWPEVNNGTGYAWYIPVEIQVASSNNAGSGFRSSRISADTRARPIIKALQYARLTYGQVYEPEDPQIIKRDEKDRFHVWTWRFSLRYAE